MIKIAHLVEDVLQAALGQGTAFHVFHRTEFSGESFALFGRDWPLLLTGEFLQVALVFTQIDLGSLDVS